MFKVIILIFIINLSTAFPKFKSEYFEKTTTNHITQEDGQAIIKQFKGCLRNIFQSLNLIIPSKMVDFRVTATARAIRKRDFFYTGDLKSLEILNRWVSNAFKPFKSLALPFAAIQIPSIVGSFGKRDISNVH